MKAVCQKHHAAYEVSTGCPDCVVPNQNGDAFPKLTADDLWAHFIELRLDQEYLEALPEYKEVMKRIWSDR